MKDAKVAMNKAKQGWQINRKAFNIIIYPRDSTEQGGKNPIMALSSSFPPHERGTTTKLNSLFDSEGGPVH